MADKPTYEELSSRVRNLEAAVMGHRQAILTLQEDIERYRILFDNMIDEVHIWKLVRDKQGAIKTWRLEDVNPAGLEAWGKTRSETIGKTSDEIFSYDATAHFMPIVKKIFEEGTPITWESHFPATGQVLHMTSVPFGEYFISTGADITERRQAEKNLKESEKKYRQLTETMLETLSVIDLDGVFLYSNRNAARNLSGEEFDDITGKNIRQFLPSRQAEQFIKLYRNVYSSKEPYSQEFMVHLKTGATWFANTLKPIDFGSSQTPAVLSVSLDITDRKQAEQNYQTLFQEMIDGFALHEIICNEAGQPVNYRFLAVNPAFEKMTGLNADRILGRNVLDVIPELEPVWIETYGKVALSGQPAFIENYAKAIGRHFQVRAFQPSPGRFACIFVDITEKLAAENRLRESEEKFRNFTEQSFVGFYVIQGGVLKYVNPKFGDIFGYTVDECMNGMRLRQFIHTEDLAMVQEQVRRRVDGEIDAVQYTFRGVKKTGEIIHLSVYGSSMVYQGRPAAIGTILDNTKELELEKRIAQSQRMEAIGNLAGGIAHDFNNILFPIVGLSEMLMEDLTPDSHEHEYAREIYNAGRRGSDLVKQILAFSRQSEQEKMPIRIQQILKEVLKLTRSTIPSNIRITQDIQGDCGLVRADPTQIHQIALNLITNAYHAVEPKNGEIDVRLREVGIEPGHLPDSALPPGRYALLSVSDTGVGINPSILQKIFEPYFTTKEQGKGTGLGLSVVYGIVKEHQGDIRVTSELGKGATFDVYLPIMAQAVETAAAGEKGELPTGNERILLVDDEKAIAKLEKAVLERLGYTVTMHVNSLAALEAFKAGPGLFDLVICDITMPNMTGDLLAREMIAIWPDIPIIICTGFSERLNPENAMLIGIKSFLMKPIVKEELATVVREVLDAAKKSP